MFFVRIAKLVLMVFLVSFVSTDASEYKIIIGASKKLSDAQRIKQRLETVLLRDPDAMLLQKKYHFHIVLERLNKYTLVTLSPFMSSASANEVNSIIHPAFPEAFAIDSWEKKSAASSTKPLQPKSEEPLSQNRVHTNTAISQKQKSGFLGGLSRERLVHGVDNEWLALIVLALVGMLLVFRSNRQIKKIKKLQKALEETQDKNERSLSRIEEEL